MDTRRFYVSKGEDVYGPLEKDQIKGYLDDSVFSPEDGVFCQGWEIQVTLRDYFSEWFGGQPNTEETPTTASTTTEEAPQKKTIKRKLNPRMHQSTQGADAHQREYLLTRKLVSETDLEKITPFVAESIIKINNKKVFAVRMAWLGFFIASWAIIAAVAILLYKNDDTYTPRPQQTATTQPTPTKQAEPTPTVTAQKAPEPEVTIPESIPTPQAPKPKPDLMVPTVTAEKSVTRGLISMGTWEQYPIRSREVILLSRIDASLRRLLEKQLSLFTKLESQGTDEEVKRYSQKIVELQKQRPNLKSLDINPAITATIDDYLNAFDSVNYNDIVPKIAVYVTDMRDSLETILAPVDAAKRELITGQMREYTSKWERLAGEISLNRSTTNYREDWAQFAKTGTPEIANQVEQSKINAINIKPDGSFRLTGEGILVARIQIGPYILYAPEGWSEHPITFTRPEF